MPLHLYQQILTVKHIDWVEYSINTQLLNTLLAKSLHLKLSHPIIFEDLEWGIIRITVNSNINTYIRECNLHLPPAR